MPGSPGTPGNPVSVTVEMATSLIVAIVARVILEEMGNQANLVLQEKQ